MPRASTTRPPAGEVPLMDLGGIRFADVGPDDALRVLDGLRRRQGTARVAFVNAHTFGEAHTDEAFGEVLASFDLCFADGAPVRWLLTALGGGARTRVPGPATMHMALSDPEFQRRRHALFGATDEILRRIRARYPDANIVAAMSPPFGDWEHERSLEYCARLREVEPDFVWVGLGAPKQERWIHRYAPHLAPAVCLGVGAAFERCAGLRRDPPPWMGKHGLEWLYRMGQEPRRLGARYLRTNPRFMYVATKVIAKRLLRAVA